MSKLVLTLMLVGLVGFMPALGPPGPPLPAAAEARDRGTAPASRVERLEQDFRQAVSRVQPVVNRYGYPAVFLTILVEGVGIPAPGTNHSDRGRPDRGARQSQHRLGDDLGLYGSGAG